MHLNKGYLGEKHCFITKVSHHSLHLPHCFIDCATMFVALKGRVQCLSLSILFWDDVDIVAFFTMHNNKFFWYYKNLTLTFNLSFKLRLFKLLKDFQNISIGFFSFSKLFKKSILFVFSTSWPPNLLCIDNFLK